MQQIVEFRWFVLLSGVQKKMYVVTNETFPNLLFATLFTQFKNIFGKYFRLQKFHANLTASPGFSNMKFLVLLCKVCNRVCLKFMRGYNYHKDIISLLK